MTEKDKSGLISERAADEAASYRDLTLVCPSCHGELSCHDDHFHCRSCTRTYSQHGGIPDLRLFEDPYLDFEADRERTAAVLDALEHHDLKSLLEHYWSRSDVTPQALREKFIRSAMLGKNKSARTIGVLKRGPLAQHRERPLRVLEIGSGTGSFLAEASREFDRVVGVDIAMRWLHVSRRRFMDEELPAPPLVCACAEKLPFPDGYFDLVVATAVLEFTQSPEAVFAECARVLKGRGSMHVSTVNRYSLACEPHVYLWGVGFLPRAWQAPYVRWRRDASYENIHLLSFRRLRRMARAHFPYHRICNQDIADESLPEFFSVMTLLVRLYRLANRFPPTSYFLKWFGPGWEAEFSKGRLSTQDD